MSGAAGSATCSVTFPSPGAHAVQAAFGGSGILGGSAAALTETVNPAATSVTVSVAPGAAGSGQPATYTATVGSSYGVPTGTVAFAEGSTPLCDATVGSDGKATCVSAGAPGGSGTVTATYSGDASHAASSGTVELSAPGYRLVSPDGGVFAFGAPFAGSLGGVRLAEPIMGVAAAPGGGYWLVGADGGVFAFGPGAGFFGSLGGTRPGEPVLGIAGT